LYHLPSSAHNRLTLCDTISRTNAPSVMESTLSITRATTLPLRFTAPATANLPCPPVPPKSPRPPGPLCLFLALPPIHVSSTSTTPTSLRNSLSRSAVLTLWHMSHAVL